MCCWSQAADNPLPLPDGLRKPFVTRAESTARWLAEQESASRLYLGCIAAGLIAWWRPGAAALVAWGVAAALGQSVGERDELSSISAVSRLYFRWLAEQEGGDAAPFASLGTITPPGAEGSEVVVHTAQPPVLCTGFEGSVASVARNLFAFADEADEAKGCLCGAAMLTDDDESTAVPGVFLVGPSVSHGDLSFCFVYKFRQRFGIVADKICRGLGRDTAAAVAECRKTNMYLDDLSCCVGSCGTC